MGPFLTYTKVRCKDLYLVCILLFFTATAHSQVVKPYLYQEKLQKADERFNVFDYNGAIELYKEIIEKFGTDTSVTIRIANSFRLLNNPTSAEEWYRKALVDNKGPINPLYKLHFAQILTMNKKYHDALYWFKEYYKNSSTSDLRAQEAIASIENISTFYEDTIFYVAYPLDMNSKYAEFGVCRYKDGMVFLSDRSSSGQSYLSWYFSTLGADGNFSKPVRFDVGFKAKYNQGPLVFYDNYKKVIFSQNYLPEFSTQTKEVPLQLFSASVDANNQWKDIKMIPFKSKGNSFTQPSVSGDGNTLYFSSDVAGGFGGTDLYMSKLQNNKWGQPVNLGNKINTPGDEMFPFVFQDSLLYFSSNGHGGLGGLDIFKVNLKNNSKPENLGAPINSPNDDFGIVLDKDGSGGYFASNRPGGSGADDIYRFKVIRKTRSIKIIDGNTSLPLSNVDIFGIDNGHEKRLGVSDQDGGYDLVVPIGKAYQIRLKVENYESKNYTLETGLPKQNDLIVIPLKAVEKIEAVPFIVETKKEEQVNAPPAPESLKQEKVAIIPPALENKPSNPQTKKIEERVILSDKSNKPIVNPKNVVYKVQIFASRISTDEAEVRLKYKGNLKIGSFYEDQWYKYSIGEFTTYTEAKQCLYESKVYDAFIIAYMDGGKVKITIAKAATNETEVEKPERRYMMINP
jgi:tetratricopeptide (TPR) repeat protein